MLAPLRDLGPLEGPVLVFGGPYGNLEAARALREAAEGLGLGPDQVICTGDLAAYCAHPRETVRLIREWGIPVVMGNCEESLGREAPDCGCGFAEGSACAAAAEGWYAHAAARIDADDRDWMRALPRLLRFELGGRRFLAVHGGVDRINRFVFASTPTADKAAELERASVDCIIGGHCGIPFGQQIGRRAWLNAGAIGLPANDGTPDGWYLALEPDEGAVRARWHRLAYDAPAAAAAMLDAGPDAGYAAALVTGLWPGEDVLPEAERSRRGRPIRLEVLEI